MCKIQSDPLEFCRVLMAVTWSFRLISGRHFFFVQWRLLNGRQDEDCVHFSSNTTSLQLFGKTGKHSTDVPMRADFFPFISLVRHQRWTSSFSSSHSGEQQFSFQNFQTIFPIHCYYIVIQSLLRPRDFRSPQQTKCWCFVLFFKRNIFCKQTVAPRQTMNMNYISPCLLIFPILSCTKNTYN